MGISGTSDDQFSGVKEAFAANFEPNDTIYDEGASVAITIDGELVVDLWGGTATRDAGPRIPWESDTIINVWSTTKTVGALALPRARRPGSTSTSTRPSPRTGRSSPPRARVTSGCAT